MTVRQATISDAKPLAQLNLHVQHIHTSNRPDLYRSALLTGDLISWFEEKLADQSSRIYLAEIGDMAVGYICIVIRHSPENVFKNVRHDMIIDQMSVNPEYYGTGVADRLMEAALDLARHERIHRIVLDVWDWNVRARHFYQKMGFTTCTHNMELILD